MHTPLAGYLRRCTVYGAGIQAATRGEYAKAEVIFARMLSEDPSLASVWSNLGNVHMSQGRAKQAFDDYTRAVQLAPDAPVPYLNRAIALEELGLQLAREGHVEEAGARWREALADCDSAISRDVREFAAWFNKGNVELRLEDYEAALGCFSTAADLAPGIAGYRLRAAQLMYQVGNSEGAVRAVKGVIRKNPNYAEAHTTLAAMLWSQGQLAAAEGQLEAALELGGRWRDEGWLAANTRWPPKLEAAMKRLLDIEAAGGPAAAGGAAGGASVQLQPQPLA
ncbi:hypothetical protein VOLCADRAFT_86720 [Volvox carteri f. nagariensis]|uniref:Uncharacterized protein n=1 Tax=Volvox carteri f. nagariensis TaxID=3068 RepID=D8TJF3_VOLCA|nr:uncharacterized protein VOLCADRAFT_86720 [Volvox carteri f. nagariensis]EFJ52362.1 hypothetical protein VOLCADRAFT_86720 [Volvox carteri f. nagariensis]|eukprot:XP_002946435.1 hypothetical protein VOLCADRAFT_86720 [Volvox carteri f. nagariensis]